MGDLGLLKAGETIRREDTRRLQRVIDLLALTTASVTAARSFRHQSLSLPLGGGVMGGVIVSLGVRWRLGRTARAILAGNQTVLADIGPATARFVALMHAAPVVDDARFARFAATLRPGPSASGGQDLLRAAFRQYSLARGEPDRKRQHERMLLANGYAILHEHERLQPYLEAAMPSPLRRWTTAHLLTFHLGDAVYRVSQDVPPPAAGTVPPTLATLALPELREFYSGPRGWDPSPGTLAGSAAGDWTILGDRMGYIVNLFRAHHLAPELFRPPRQ